MKKLYSQGFSILEMLLFIVVVGILGSSVFIGYQQVLVNARTPSQMIIASQHAQARLELLLMQRRLQGFAAFTDPCDSTPGLSVCTVSTRVLPASLPLAASGTQQIIEVTGSAPDGTTVSLSTLVGNY